MSSYLGPLRRFWWLLLVAVPVALAASLLVIYEAQFSPLPTLVERHKPTYKATVQVLVTSRKNPYLKAEQPPPSEQTTTSRALLEAANYLPFIVQSDRVAAIRTKKFGKVDGEVNAQALFARVTTNRGLRPSAIPIIEVNGFAPTEQAATRLARGSVNALIVWLTTEQRKSNVPQNVRVLLEPLRSPGVTVQQQQSTGLAMLVLVVVLLGFLALAWMLDRVFAEAKPTTGKATDQEPEATSEPEPARIRAEPASTSAGPISRPGATLGSVSEPAPSATASIIHSVDGGPPVEGDGSGPSAVESAESSEASQPARKRRRA